MTLIADEIIVSDHGGSNPRRLMVTGVSCSWELNTPGEFSCFTSPEELERARLGYSLSGKWVTWSGRPGAWGGVITGKPLTGGVPEVAASGWAALLSGRAILSILRKDQSTLGGLAALAVVGSDAESEAGSLITLGTIDDIGEFVTVDFGTEDVLDDFLPSLVDAGALEWIVDQDRRLHAGKWLGRDVSHRVRLVEGVHIIPSSESVGDDMWSKTAAELVALETNEQRISGTPPPGVSVGGGAGRRRRNRRRARKKRGGRDRWRPGKRNTDVSLDPVEPVPGTPGVPWLDSTVGVSLRTLWVPQQSSSPLETVPMEFAVRDVDDVWRHCQPGNVVRIVLGRARFSGWFRILNRGYVAADGELVLSGEALSDARAPL